MARFVNKPETIPDGKKFFHASLTLLKKLEWEIQQLERSLMVGPQDDFDLTALFHAHNCAITAWHISDWVYEEHYTLIGEGLDGVFAPCINVEAFQKFVRDESDWLHVCHQLATCSKHWVLKKTRSDAALTTKIDPQFRGARAGEAKSGDPIGKYLLKPEVQWEGETWPAEEIFKKARDYWKTKLVKIPVPIAFSIPSNHEYPS